MRDVELSSGSVKVEVIRRAGSLQLLQNVIVKKMSDTTQPHVFTLIITVCPSSYAMFSVIR